MRLRFAPCLALALTGASTARAVATSGQDPAPISERYDLRHHLARFDLPHRLDEVSGLAFSDDGRLYAHQDETGVVYAIDPETGDVDRGFTLGSTDALVHDDFEGLAVAGDRFFLLSSRGLLYEFRRTAEGRATPARLTDTGLGRGCEAEGLTFDASTRSLLVACKTVAPRADEIRVHWLPLDPDAPVPPPLRVPFRRLAPFGLENGLHPSGIDVDPATGTLVLVAAREEAIVEISREGRVLSVFGLGRGRHPQAEGIAFGPQGRLFVADEGHGRRAHLTVYGRAGEDGTGKGAGWDGV